MIKILKIIDKSSDRIIAKYPCVMQGSVIDKYVYIKEAWKNALDEGLVDKDNRDNYDIQIVEDAEEISPE